MSIYELIVQTEIHGHGRSTVSVSPVTMYGPPFRLSHCACCSFSHRQSGHLLSTSSSLFQGQRGKIGLYSPNEEQWATEEEDIWTEENRETRRTKKGHELMNLFRKMAASGGDKNSSSERTSDYTERSPIFGDSFREKEEREKTSHVVVFLCVETCFLGIFLFSRFLIISFWGSI